MLRGDSNGEQRVNVFTLCEPRILPRGRNRVPHRLFMKEGFSLPDNKQENSRLLHDAEYVINAMWEKVMDVSDFPLNADLSYQAWLEDFQKRKSVFAKVLFDNARKAAGEEKFRSAQTLRRLLKLLNNKEQQEVLNELMTTREAIQELARGAEEQVLVGKSTAERVKSKFQKTLDRFLRRDDDFDDDLK